MIARPRADAHTVNDTDVHRQAAHLLLTQELLSFKTRKTNRLDKQ